MTNETYVNYYEKGEEIIASFPKGKKPRLLMHVCCAPCACFPLTYVCEHFDLTIYYNNSNIYPSEEYEKRLGELKKLVSYMKRDYGYDIPLIVPTYDYDTYMKDLRPYASEPECGKRCWICYRKRMEEAYDYAEKEGYDYFCTVMTISREKNSQILNYIGSELEAKHPHTKYFYSDFKKKNGILKGVEMRKGYDLYYQKYCGCEYSKLAREKWDAKKALENQNLSK